MDTIFYNQLKVREIFHIEFLRSFTRKFRPSFYALKGGVNLRLYFKSIRYSEDMDLDINLVDIVTLRDTVIKILTSTHLINELKPFGIEEIRLPNIEKAKQTNPTQRFKIHIITHRNEDLFTKIEFSRRKSYGTSITESVPENILRQYKLSPFIINHYNIHSVIIQKINALSGRNIIQPRDIFDLYMLSTQYVTQKDGKINIAPKVLKTATENLFSIDFRRFRDTVISYLSNEDRVIYDNPDIWDEIKLKVNELICQKNQQ